MRASLCCIVFAPTHSQLVERQPLSSPHCGLPSSAIPEQPTYQPSLVQQAFLVHSCICACRFAVYHCGPCTAPCRGQHLATCKSAFTCLLAHAWSPAHQSLGPVTLTFAELQHPSAHQQTFTQRSCMHRFACSCICSLIACCPAAPLVTWWYPFRPRVQGFSTTLLF